VADLVERTPCAGLLPLEKGDLTLREAPILPLHVIMPFRGGTGALADLGIGLPEPGRQVAFGAGHLRWFGRGCVLGLGVDLPPGTDAHAAVSDQSDGWARMVLEGPGAEAVLSRLVPVDLRAPGFGVDATCRSLLGHMNASITRTSDTGFEIMVFRSMARTAVHELGRAMGHVVARSFP